ncbi:hypothetical protein MKW98_010906 [Papaver atlanticum]|uniref:Uncharacterized protein n=1 Tax=Papaver atlanticum TaxID=357466 RepID=A0AAD4SMC1_9MAGN|nr:hypothetical protein MKW98_010906 [Papaver atlanticum]
MRQLTGNHSKMVEGSSGAVNDMATTMVQKLWDSALALDLLEDDYDTQRDHLILSTFIVSVVFDDEGNKVLLTTDSDLAGAISHARTTAKIKGNLNVLNWLRGMFGFQDHMCRAGGICFSQVFHEDGGTTGIVDYTNND